MHAILVSDYKANTGHVSAPAESWREIPNPPAGLQMHRDGSLSCTLPLAAATAVYGALELVEAGR